MSWWLWLLLGVALLLAELLTPGGFFILFFGLGALSVGLVTALLPLDLRLQLILFIALSVASLATLRGRLMAMRAKDKNKVDSLVGEAAFALDEIPAEGYGKAELRGSTWNARNVGPHPIQKAQRCTVERVEGLTICIRG